MNPLPPLPSISDSQASVTPSPSVASTIASGISNAVTGGVSSALLGGLPIQRVVVIVLGLLLIAAGIFAFKPVRETVVTSAKAAAMA